jgi:arylsulfatase A-like enzyme
MRLLFLLLLVSSASLAQRPNIIYIMSDDHDKDAISAYSKTLLQTPQIDRLAKEGMLFQKAFVGNSICGPVRATVLTGQHSHKNGQIDNLVRFDSSKITVPKLLQKAGYQTAIVGKWHLKSLPTGFDFWKVLPGQGLYFQPRLIDMKNDTATYKGYATNVITDEALGWLDRRDKTKPFFLMLHHKAPHRYFFPPLKYIQAFHNRQFPEPSTLYLDTTGRGTAWKKQTMTILYDMKLSSDLKVDPAYLMNIPHLKPDSAEIAYYNAIMNRIPADERQQIKEIYKERGELIQRLKPSGKDLLKLKYQWYMQDFLACVASVDENIGRLLDYLDKNDLTNNTMIVYTSDQGFYLGENGWYDKRFMYDQSMQIPLLIRWPGKIKPGTSNASLVQNIDFAPTFLDAAGEAVPDWMQGLSLKPLLLQTKRELPRQALYYRFYEVYADHTVLPHLGIRTKTHKLIYFHTVDEWELYDLQKDPDELNNLYHQKSYQPLVAELKRQLIALKKQYDDNEAAGSLQ